MLTFSFNPCSHKSLCSLLIVVAVSIGFSSQAIDGEVYAASCEILIDEDFAENDVEGMALEQHSPPAYQYLYQTDSFPVVDAADSNSGFLHHAELVRAPPDYIFHS